MQAMKTTEVRRDHPGRPEMADRGAKQTLAEIRAVQKGTKAPSAAKRLSPTPLKTKFSDDRFAKLFPARAGGRNFVARNVAKPKPTLPSFIKSTPPLLKVQVNTTPAPKGGLGRVRATAPTTKRPSALATTARPRGRNGLQPTQRQLTGRLTTSRPTSGPNSASGAASAGSASSATPSAAALAAARRARQGNGISRFNRGGMPSSPGQQQPNSNSTIPALNPRRN
ncbi:hypothetical protein TYRP_001866 [Tyrophagus putrescentiae]|nr:hypothetical protein TYRP_001866 [Tyrophagus putrescentiae]